MTDVRPGSGAHGPELHARRYGGTSSDWSEAQQHHPNRGKHDPVAAEIRNLAADRVARMNVQHARHAFDRLTDRRHAPLSPYGLAFLYLDIEARERPRYVVQAATRLFHDDPTTRDIHDLLGALVRIARQRIDRYGVFDPRLDMTDRQDEMTPAATYCGLGLSSLDIRPGSWAELARNAFSRDLTSLDVPGWMCIYLKDSTRMILSRQDHSATSARIRSTTDLNVRPMQPARIWGWLHDYPSSVERLVQALHGCVIDGNGTAGAPRPHRRRA